MKSTFTSLLFTISMGLCPVFGQEIDIALPAAPEAAALMEYVDIPVSEYTGIPSIEVPLYTLNQGTVSVPVSLSYHAGGNRVSEEASWVGLGWSLNAGGVITRTIRDEDDFGFKLNGCGGNYPGYYDVFDARINDLPGDPQVQEITEFFNVLNGLGYTAGWQFLNNFASDPSNWPYYLNNGLPEPYIGNDGSEVACDLLYLTPEQHDTEPDIYSFNFMGYSGKFVLNKEKDFICLEDKTIKVEYQGESEGWVITVGNGTKFFFGNTENSQQYTYTGTSIGEQTVDLFSDYSATPPSCEDDYVSSWYLTSVVGPDGSTVNFDYYRQAKSVVPVPIASEIFRIPQQACTYDADSEGECKIATVTQVKYDEVVLSKVSGDFEEIFFVRSAGRLDLIGASTLDLITINRDNQYYKSFKLNYEYFDSSPLDEDLYWPSYFKYENSGGTISYNSQHKRLKLMNIETIGLNNQKIPPYEFIYNATALPPKTSMQMDFWGYANGNDEGGAVNTSLAPSDVLGTQNFREESSTCWYGYFTPSSYSSNSMLYVKGADRKSRLDYCRASILEGIKWPTGSKTTFQYELNTYSNIDEEFRVRDIETSSLCRSFYVYQNLSDPSAYHRTFQITDIDEDFLTPVFIRADWNMENCSEFYVQLRITGENFDQTFDVNQEPNSLGFSHSRVDSDYKPQQFPRGLPNFSLSAGTYDVELIVYPCSEQIGYDVTLDMYEGVPVEIPKIGAGLRVKTLTTNEGNGDKIQRYNYDIAGVSSGKLRSVPIFKKNVAFWFYSDGSYDWYTVGSFPGAAIHGAVEMVLPLTRIELSSSSGMPLTNLFAGNLVGYSFVSKSVEDGEGNSYGFEESTYYNESPETDERVFNQGVQVPLAYSALNGALLNRRILKANPDPNLNDPVCIYEQSNQYSLDSDFSEWIWSVYEFEALKELYANNGAFIGLFYYALVPQQRELRKTIENYYGTDLSGPLVKETVYDYNLINGKVSEVTESCGQDIKTTKYKYATDLSQGGKNGDISAMTARNMVNIPLETVINDGSGGGSKVAYSLESAGVLPKAFYRWENDWSEYPVDEIKVYEGRFPKEVKYKKDAETTGFMWDNGLIKEMHYPVGGNGRKWVYTYDGRQVAGITDPSGVVSVFDYDDLWRLERRGLNNDRINQSYAYTYGGNGGANQIESHLTYPLAQGDLAGTNLETRSYFDGAGRLLTVDKIEFTQDRLSYVTGQVFNAVGQKVAEIDPADGGTTIIYYEPSILNRVIGILPPATPNEHAIQMIHSIEGNRFVEEVIDENGHSTRTYRDIFGRVRKVDQEGITTEYSYTDRDQVEYIYPPGGALPYEYSYLPNGLLESKLVPDKGMAYMIDLYNDQDQVLEETLPNGVSILTEYHPTYNHLVVRKIADDVVVSEYEYEDADRNDWIVRYGTEVLETGEILSTIFKDFDDLGRPESETKHYLQGVSIKHFEYDDADNIVQERRQHLSSLGGGNTIFTHDYDRGIRVESTKAGITGMPACEFYGQYTYDARDLLTNGNYYDGLYSTAYTYHQRGWLETINGVNSTFQNGEKPNCEDGPNSLPPAPPGCVGPIQIVNVSLFYDCIALGAGTPTNVHVEMQGATVDYGEEGPTHTSSFTIPINGGSLEELPSYPDHQAMGLSGDPETGGIPHEAYDQIVALIVNCLGEANLGAIKNPQTYNDVIALINGLIQGGDQSDNSGASGLFGMNLHYMEENTALEAPAQFNGNVAWMEWAVPYEDLQQYGFGYDPHDRLVQAKYRAFDKEQCIEKNVGAYDVHINAYDQLGNIQELQRFGMTGTHAGVPTYGMIDNMEYSYDQTLVNRLIGLNEHSEPSRGFNGTLGESFSYDAVGNMTGQSNIGLQNAVYNFMDLPQILTMSNGTIHNYYTADGQKLMSVTDETGVGSTTHYYEDGFEYEDGKLVAIYHPEGRVVFNGELETKEGTLTTYPEWVIRDHLGNTRVRFVDKDRNGEIDIYKNDVLGTELIGSYHYYPFGMTFEGDFAEQQGEKTDYLYNGKELAHDLNLNWYDYEARFYDPSMGRFTGVDPLASEMPAWSPYNFTFNNPIRFTDPDGRAPEDIIILNNSNGASGFGHMALLVGNDDTGWTFISKEGRARMEDGGKAGTLLFGGKPDVAEQRFDCLGEALSSDVVTGSGYNEGYRIETSEEQDAVAIETMRESSESRYHVGVNNCADACSDALEAVGLNGGTRQEQGKWVTHEIRDPQPNKRYDQVVKRNPEGEEVKIPESN